MKLNHFTQKENVMIIVILAVIAISIGYHLRKDFCNCDRFIGRICRDRYKRWFPKGFKVEGAEVDTMTCGKIKCDYDCTEYWEFP